MNGTGRVSEGGGPAIRWNFLFSLFLSLLFAFYLYLALGYPARARMMPLVIGVPGLALCLVQLASDLSRLRAAAAREEAAGGRAGDESGEEEPPLTLRQEVAMFGWAALLAGLILAFGFLLGVPLFFLLFLRLRSRESWWVTALATAGAALGLYLIFVEIMGLVLFEGFLFGALS